MNNDANNRVIKMFRAYNNGDYNDSFKVADGLLRDTGKTDYLTFCFHLKLVGAENVDMLILIERCLNQSVKEYYRGILKSYYLKDFDSAQAVFLKLKQHKEDENEYPLYTIFKAQSGLYLVAQRSLIQSAAIECHYSLINKDKYNFLMGKPSSVNYSPDLHTPRVLYGIISDHEEEQYKRQDIKEIFPENIDNTMPGFIIPDEGSTDPTKKELYPGATWHDVRLTIDHYNGNIKISVVGYRSKIIHHCKFGFPNDKPEIPSVLWKIFLDLVSIKNNEGFQKIITAKDDPITKTYKSHISRIRTILKKYFGILSDPLYDYHDKKCYLLKFQVKLGDVDFK